MKVNTDASAGPAVRVNTFQRKEQANALAMCATDRASAVARAVGSRR